MIASEAAGPGQPGRGPVEPPSRPGDPSGSPDKIDMLGEPGPTARRLHVIHGGGQRPAPGAAGYDHRPITNVPLRSGRRDASLRPGALEARYPLDVLYARPALRSPPSEREAMGYDRAFQEPAPFEQGTVSAASRLDGLGTPWAHISIGTRLASHGFVVAVLHAAQ
ncbi:MAG: hypothetical protein MZV65_53085 [Chromatiales bacterium]|nr:hypothetical protein [Chromatiales bacterium]